MIYLYLFNALVLILIGGFVFIRNRDRLSLILVVMNTGLAVWNICILLTDFYPELVNIDLVSRLKLVSAMVFVNGTFYFCRSYPFRRSDWVSYLNFPIFLGLSFSLLFTDLVTSASLVEGRVTYTDHPWGFPICTLYLALMGLGALLYLFAGYREHESYRSNIRYLLIGLGLYYFFSIVFNLLLPVFGIYELLGLGRVSSMLPALFFAYIIVKHDFMDMEVIINKYTAWIVTCGIVLLSFVMVYQVFGDQNMPLFIAYTSAGMFWAMAAFRLQNFLLTTARHKFVRGWYDSEDVISGLAGRITSEKDRAAIFSILESALDDVFQMQTSETIIAMRDNDPDTSSGYMVVRKEGRNTWKNMIHVEPLMDAFQDEVQPMYLDSLHASLQENLVNLGFRLHHMTVLIPLHSPEQLEGLIILGSKSTQEPYSERDIRFFSRLVNYLAAILYRLTPMEKLEQLYLENKQKLHAAEIQLLRAQKIESIVHATRQCHHEIRTPLSIIQLGIRRIKNIDDLENYKQVAEEEVARALEIVEETLTITDVNKSEDDRFSYVNVNDVLQRVSRLVDSGRYNLSIEANAENTIWGVFSDIQVAVTNLVHNAMDAMPDGGMLSLSSRDSYGNVLLEVEDTGQGISEDLRAKVWEPYFSGHKTEVGNSTAGRGWGLTIVNRIVTEHKGTVNFSSEPGVGTRFTITLPAASAQHALETGEDEKPETHVRKAV